MKVESVKRLALFVGLGAVVLAGALCAVLHGARAWHAAAARKRVRTYSEIIWRHSRAAALPPELVEAVICAESGGDPRAISSRGAKGLMQIMSVAKRDALQHTGLPQGDLFDPDYNVRVGTTYLRMLTDRFDGDLYLALAAYHMGPTRLDEIRRADLEVPGKELVERHAGRATVRYCRRILGDASPRLPVKRRNSCRPMPPNSQGPARGSKVGCSRQSFAEVTPRPVLPEEEMR